MQATAPPTTPMDAWRAELVGTILRVMLVAGAVVGVPSIGYAIVVEEYGIVVLDVVALAAAAFLTYAPGLHYRTRAWGLLATVYALGVGLLATVGLVSQIYLMAVPLLAALLIGLRASVAGLVLNATTLTVAGLTGWFGGQLQLLGSEAPYEWVVITVNFLFVNGVLAISCAVLLRRLEHSLAEEQRVSSSLARQHTELQDTNRELTREVTERRRARAEATRLAAAVTRARDVILIGDEGGRVTYGNDAARALRATLGRSGGWASLGELASDPRRRDELLEAVRAGRSEATTITFGGDGVDTIEFDARLTPIPSETGDGPSSVVVLRDVTEDRRIEARLRHAEKLEALGTLASGTAHDFNNVLASILAVAEHASVRTQDVQLRDDLAAIVGACDRARGVVQQLVSFGLPSSSGRERVQLRDVVQTALPLIRAALPSRITLEVDLRSDRHLVARSSELEQVLTNLVTNAAHAVADAPEPVIGIQLIDAVAVTADGGSEPLDQVVLSVSDRGAGIDPAHLPRIFDPFFTTKGATEGSGLGLASVHGIVTSLGGEVEVETQAGRGTTFHVRIPATDGDTPQPAAADDAPRTSGPSADTAVGTRPGPGIDRPSERTGGARVLLADDEELIRRLAAQSLSRFDFEVITAADGREALALFRGDPAGFDVLVTDLTMPAMDGAELIAEVHAIRPDLPVIVCTGNADDARHGAIPGESIRLTVAKPYSITDLARHIGEALAAP